MDRRGLVVAATIVGALMVSGSLSLPFSSEGIDGAGWVFAQTLGNQGSNFYRWKRLLLENASEMAVGCDFKDCIPPIYEPEFVTASQADQWLVPSDLVIGLEYRGAIKAYPIKILNYHEVVNDRADGRPILITFCPLCDSAVGFRRTLGDATLTFGVSGLLHHSNLVMYDHETESFWDQITGEAIGGPHAADRLERVPIDVVAWADWKDAHPATRVLARPSHGPSEYDRSPYGEYRETDSVHFNTEYRDARLSAKTEVIGVSAGRSHLAIPRNTLRSQSVINTSIDETPVVVVRDPGTGAINAFSRRVDGQTISFRSEGDDMVDLVTQTRWRRTGEAVEGPYRGTQLSSLNVTPAFWFAWVAYHPDTAVFKRESNSDCGVCLPVIAGIGVAGLGIFLVVWRRRRRLDGGSLATD